MIDQLSTVTAGAVSLALDALMQRQQLIATNIANANSVNYAVRDLRMDDAFAQVLDTLAGGDAEASSALQGLRSDLAGGTYMTRDGSQPVQLDAELLRLNETAIRYQALIEGLGRYGSLARMAISGEIRG